MVYKNFFLRFLSSLFLTFIYLVLFIYYSNGIIYFVTLAYFAILIEIFIYFNRFKYILITYIVLSYTCVVYYFNYNFNIYEFTAIILFISCFDISCYIFGKMFGSNKILINISPSKTLEGLMGGILTTNLVSIMVSMYINVPQYLNSGNLLITTNLIILFSFFGDLIQSYFKRLNNLKDSGKYIPGHGGFFDRFDSFLLVIIPLSLLKILF